MKAFKIMARDSRGGQRVQSQQLDGSVVADRAVAWALAEQLAVKQTQQTGSSWTAVIEEYTVGNKPGSELF